MNYKITKEQHEKLLAYPYKEYLFGSQLHGIANEDSDFDYVRIIPDSFYDNFNSLARYLPNIHSFQYTEGKEVQYLWMTETQFWKNFFSGDGNLHADIVLLSGEWGQAESLKLCYCYRVIKGFLGVTKRDLKLHKDWKKKVFHSLRSLYMAEKLMKKELPTVSDIKELYNEFLSGNHPSTQELEKKEKELRAQLNDMLNKGEIDLFPHFKESDELVQIMASSNNIREFRYENTNK